MAGRLFRALDCYPHASPTNHPRIKIMLYSAAQEPWPNQSILAPIDTGFSGAVMLPQNDYQFFMVGELPRRLWKDYTTMTGPLRMRVARAFVRTGEQETLEETYVETPLLGVGKLLIGRTILNKRRLLLDGLTASTCFTESEATETKA